MPQKILVGGQAVIEGVMMRRQGELAIAVRRPNKEIALLLYNFYPAAQRWPILGLPLLRGSVNLVEALVLGVKALTLSANESLEEEEEELSGWQLFLTVTVAVALAVGLFFLLPTILMNLFRGYLSIPLLLNLGEGIMRVVIFIGYVYLIGCWQDIKRVFQYHGAEHKAIYCLEAGDELNVENARRHLTCHPRCGTNFILIVMIISIIFFSLFGWPSPWLRLLVRIALLPAVAGLAYEVIRLAGSSRHRLIKLLVKPGLWLQRLTTAEPDDSQLEVALSALKAVLSPKGVEHQKQA